MTSKPTRGGFYWARWIIPAPGTHDADEVTWPLTRWEVVEVWENCIGMECKADEEQGIRKFGVSVVGIRETQWLDNFQWDVGPSGKCEPIPEPGCES